MVRQKLGVLLWLKGQAMHGLGRTREALSLAQSACEELSRYRDPDSLWKAQWLRARTLAAVERTEEALSAFADAVTTIDGLRKASLGYRLDSTYLRDKLPVFEDAIAVTSARGDAERCCRMIEMVKSRALTATLSLPAAERRDQGEIEKKIDELSRRMDAAEYRGYAEGWTAELEQERTRLQAERAVLLERQRFSDPRWRSLSEPVSLDVSKLQELLARRVQAALSLFQHDDVVTCILATGSSLHVADARLSATTQKSLSRYVSNLRAKRPVPEWFDLSEHLNVGAEDILPPALLEQALEAGSLVMVPHGMLHVVPWAGLRYRGKRLAERISVGVLPNLSCISMLDSTPPVSASVVLIGAPDCSRLPDLPPLPLSRDELYSIADLYSRKGMLAAEVAEGASATEERFWELTRSERHSGSILHVATHGDFVTGEPMSSGLLFTDGRADAAEIASRRLSCEEVVLSACASGFRPQEVTGIPLTGDDIVGLPGAVLEAGARSVLMSIPRVRDDAARQFMVTYHRYRSGGVFPLESFKKTQVEMLESERYPAHLWIGFTMYGCQ
jgi:CHAT domain-containing protein